MIVSKRYKRPALKTVVAKKISKLPREHWEKVYPDVLESYDFFKTLDESHLTQFTLYYIMVYDRKAPVGAATCFLMDYSLDISISGPLKRVTNSIRKLMPNIFSLKSLICGMPLGQGRIGIIGKTDTVMKAILRRMEQIAQKNKVAVIGFKDFDQASAQLLDPLVSIGFSKLDALPSTELEIKFKDFESYLKTLSSATRYDLRRKFKKTDGRVCVDLEVADFIKDDVLQQVYQLYLNVVKEHDRGFEVASIDFFKNISKNMPGKTKFFLWRIEGRLVAFLFCLVSKDILIDDYVGFDYALAHAHHLYFIKFRDTLNWCIKHGIKKYEMSQTGYATKARLGFTLMPFYIYARLRNRALRPVFNLICQFLKFENFDPELKEAKKRHIQYK